MRKDIDTLQSGIGRRPTAVIDPATGQRWASVAAAAEALGMSVAALYRRTHWVGADRELRPARGEAPYQTARKAVVDPVSGNVWPSVADAAAVLGVSQRTLYRRLRNDGACWVLRSKET
jgi:AraC-like DNA-binding protein